MIFIKSKAIIEATMKIRQEMRRYSTTKYYEYSSSTGWAHSFFYYAPIFMSKQDSYLIKFVMTLLLQVADSRLTEMVY